MCQSLEYRLRTFAPHANEALLKNRKDDAYEEAEEHVLRKEGRGTDKRNDDDFCLHIDNANREVSFVQENGLLNRCNDLQHRRSRGPKPECQRELSRRPPEPDQDNQDQDGPG